jgi:hypothetical protein
MLEECMGVGKERQVVVENIRRTGGVGKERNRIRKRVRGVRERVHGNINNKEQENYARSEYLDPPRPLILRR